VFVATGATGIIICNAFVSDVIPDMTFKTI
jgi:hypothetical protein